MYIYKLHPGNDAFEIKNPIKPNTPVFLRSLEIIADDVDSAIRAAQILMPGFDTEHSVNTLNFIELIGKH